MPFFFELCPWHSRKHGSYSRLSAESGRLPTPTNKFSIAAEDKENLKLNMMLTIPKLKSQILFRYPDCQCLPFTVLLMVP